MSSPSTLARADNNFDCLRHIAALMVFYSHTFPLFGLPEPVIVTAASKDWRPLTFGTLGVGIFFAVSGYLITASYFNNRERLKPFFLARVLRIYPAYILQYLIVCIVIGGLATSLPARDYFAALQHEAGKRVVDMLFFIFVPLWQDIDNIFAPLPGVFTHHPIPNSVNGVPWTLFFEVGMYMLIVLLLKLRTVTSQHLPLLFALGYEYVLFERYDFNAVSLIPLGLLHCGSFLLGSILFLYRDKIVPNGKAALAAIVLLACARNLSHFMALYCLLLPYIVISLAYIPSLFRFCRLHRYGDLSYGIYIYSWPVTQFSRQLFPHDFVPYFCAALAGTLALAAISWFCLEKYALRLKPTSLVAV